MLPVAAVQHSLLTTILLLRNIYNVHANRETPKRTLKMSVLGGNGTNSTKTKSTRVLVLWVRHDIHKLTNQSGTNNNIE